MASNADAPQDRTPPYAPWSTLCSFLDRLKENGVPPRVDPSVMEGMSGGTQSSLRSGMRFLGLIGDDGSSTAALGALVQARGDDSWSGVLLPVIERAYGPTLGALDVANATPAMLEAQFRAANIGGQVLEKAVRFYLSAAKEAGVPLSSYLDAGVPTRPRGSSGRRKKGAKRDEVPPAPPSDEERAPVGFTLYQYRLRREMMVRIPLPDDLTMSDVERLYAWMKTLPIEEDPF